MSSYVFSFQGRTFAPEGAVDVPDVAAHNAAVEAAELAVWQAGPLRAFGYVKLTRSSNNNSLNSYGEVSVEGKHRGVVPTYARGAFSTWLGTFLGNIHAGPRVRNNFGGYRRHIHVYGTNGRTYHGWYMESSGDYARIKMHKRHLRTGAVQW